MPAKPTRLVGMLIPDSGNEFFLTVAQQFQRALTTERCAVLVVSSDGSRRREAAHLELLLDMDVQGIVYIGVEYNMPVYDRLQRSHRPILVLDREVPVQSADFVMLDNLAGVQLAMRHLIDLGHRRIAHIQGSELTEPGRERKDAFLAACNIGPEPVIATCIPGDFTYFAGKDAATQLLAMDAAERPTAVLAGNDLAAIGAIQHFQMAGLNVPRDMSVVGFDDIAIASWIFPPLTTVRQDCEAMAQVGARFLSERMAHDEINPGVRLESRMQSVDPRLEVRGSTASPS